MERIIAVVITALLVAGCGNAPEQLAEQALESEGGGGDVDIELGDEGEASIVVETDEGTESVNFGSGELPEELTIPVMDGYEVMGSTVVSGDETLVTVQLEYPDATVEEIAAFYEDHFAGVDDVDTTQSSSGGIESRSWITGTEQVVVTRFEADGPAAVALTQTG